MAKPFGSDDIAARLGRGRVGPRSDGPTPPYRTESSSGAGGWIFVGVFVLLAGGAGAFFGSGASEGFGKKVLASIMTNPPSDEPVYTSRVAEICDRGWKNDRENRDQLHCYLTRDAWRLCDPRERKALNDKLIAFHDASERFMGRLTVASLHMVGNPGVMAMGVAEARSRDPNLTEQQREEQIGKVAEMANDYMAPANKVLHESMNEVSTTGIENDVKSLAERGYISNDDLTSKTPEFVAKNIAAAGKPTMKCS